MCTNTREHCVPRAKTAIPDKRGSFGFIPKASAEAKPILRRHMLDNFFSADNLLTIIDLGAMSCHFLCRSLWPGVPSQHGGREREGGGGGEGAEGGNINRVLKKTRPNRAVSEPYWWRFLPGAGPAKAAIWARDYKCLMCCAGLPSLWDPQGWAPKSHSHQRSYVTQIIANHHRPLIFLIGIEWIHNLKVNERPLVKAPLQLFHHRSGGCQPHTAALIG